MISIASESHTADAGVVRDASAQLGVRLATGVAVASLAASLVLRGLYLVQSWRIDWASFPMFLGDEGVHGLMALHIERGARPIFYYGAYYHGAFDAYLTAVLFELFGESLTVVRLLPGLFALAAIAATYLVGLRVYGRRGGLLAAALVALPSKFFFEWGTLSLCGYCGYAAMVVMLVALALGLLERITRGRLVLLGLVAGVSVWSNQLSVAYVAVAFAALWRWGSLARRDWAVLGIALAVGVSPLVYGNIKTPFSTFRQLGRKAVFAWTLARQDPGRAAARVEEKDDGEREYQAQPLLEVLGAQPGRDGRFSVGGTVGALILVGGALVALVQSARRRGDPRDFQRHLLLAALVAVSLVLGLGGFNGQPVGRYQLPLYPVLAVLAAGGLSRVSPKGAAAAVGGVALLHAIDIARSAETDEDTPASAVIELLDAHGLRHGIAANAMYEVVFRSGERIVIVPLDHSRYLPYEEEIASATDLFYIHRDYHERKLAHRTMLRYLQEQGVTYQTARVGDFSVLHDFQPPGAVSLATVGKIRAAFRKEKFGE